MDDQASSLKIAISELKMAPESGVSGHLSYSVGAGWTVALPWMDNCYFCGPDIHGKRRTTNLVLHVDGDESNRDVANLRHICRKCVNMRRRDAERTKRRCKVPGCGRPHYARGFCNNDYQRFIRGALGPGYDTVSEALAAVVAADDLATRPAGPYVDVPVAIVVNENGDWYICEQRSQESGIDAMAASAGKVEGAAELRIVRTRLPLPKPPTGVA